MGLEASVYANIGGDSMMKCSKTLMDRAAELAANSDDPYDSAMMHTCRTTIAWCSGRWRNCAAPAKKAIKSLHMCAGTNFDLAIVHGFALSARVFLGEIREVRDELKDLLEDAERRGDRYFMNVFQSGYLVFLHLAEDDAEGALRLAESTLQDAPDDRFTSLHFHKFNSYTNALLYSGQAWKAWMYVEKTWPDLRRAGFPALGCIGLQLREIRARCAIAAAGGNQPKSLRTDQTRKYTSARLLSIAEDEAQQIEKRSLPHARALAAVVRAGVAAMRDKPEERKRALETAANGFELEDVQMKLHAEAARFFLTAIEGDTRAHAQVCERMASRGVLRPDAMAALLLPGQA